jgi:hypothetical protein
MRWVYPVLVSVTTGAVWVDQMYTLRVAPLVSAGKREEFFSGIADNLLFLVSVTFVAGVVAAVRASGRTRWLLIASLVVLSLQVLLPAIVSAVPGATAALHGMGPLLRLVIILTALIVAVRASRQVTP